MNRRNEILSGLKNIERLNSPATGALQLIKDPNVSHDKVARVLKLDPALTASVLRFANSAYFGCSREIHTVKEAIVRLGMNTITRMLFLSSAKQFSVRPVQGYDLAPGVLWNSMISTAVGTDILADDLRIEAPPCTFTAGLLHNIGKLVLGTYLEVDAEPILDTARKQNIPFDEAERQVLGTDHAEVGAELLRQWHLPDSIVNAVRWYHDPDSCPGDRTAVDLIHVADIITMMAGSGLGIDGLQYDVCKGSEQRLEITIQIVERTLCRLQDKVLEICQVV